MSKVVETSDRRSPRTRESPVATTPKSQKSASAKAPQSAADPGKRVSNSKKAHEAVAELKETTPSMCDSATETPSGVEGRSKRARKEMHYDAMVSQLDRIEYVEDHRKGKPPKRPRAVADGEEDARAEAPSAPVRSKATSRGAAKGKIGIIWPWPSPSDIGEDDEHYHYCSMCEDGGQKLIICEGCPRVFHTKCSRDLRGKLPYWNWICPVCISVGKSFEEQKKKKPQLPPDDSILTRWEGILPTSANLVDEIVQAEFPSTLRIQYQPAPEKPAGSKSLPWPSGFPTTPDGYLIVHRNHVLVRLQTQLPLHLRASRIASDVPVDCFNFYSHAIPRLLLHDRRRMASALALGDSALSRVVTVDEAKMLLTAFSQSIKSARVNERMLEQAEGRDRTNFMPLARDSLNTLASFAPVISVAPPVSADGNEEVCATCGLGGDIICCDSCSGSYHLSCDQDLRAWGIPEGDVTCGMCTFRSRCAQQIEEWHGKLLAEIQQLPHAVAAIATEGFAPLRAPLHVVTNALFRRHAAELLLALATTLDESGKRLMAPLLSLPERDAIPAFYLTDEVIELNLGPVKNSKRAAFLAPILQCNLKKGFRASSDSLVYGPAPLRPLCFHMLLDKLTSSLYDSGFIDRSKSKSDSQTTPSSAPEQIGTSGASLASTQALALSTSWSTFLMDVERILTDAAAFWPAETLGNDSATGLACAHNAAMIECGKRMLTQYVALCHEVFADALSSDEEREIIKQGYSAVEILRVPLEKKLSEPQLGASHFRAKCKAGPPKSAAAVATEIPSDPLSLPAPVLQADLGLPPVPVSGKKRKQRPAETPIKAEPAGPLTSPETAAVAPPEATGDAQAAPRKKRRATAEAPPKRPGRPSKVRSEEPEDDSPAVKDEATEGPDFDTTRNHLVINPNEYDWLLASLTRDCGVSIDTSRQNSARIHDAVRVMALQQRLDNTSFGNGSQQNRLDEALLNTLFPGVTAATIGPQSVAHIGLVNVVPNSAGAMRLVPLHTTKVVAAASDAANEGAPVVESEVFAQLQRSVVLVEDEDKRTKQTINPETGEIETAVYTAPHHIIKPKPAPTAPSALPRFFQTFQAFTAAAEQPPNGYFSGDPTRCDGCRYGWNHVCAYADVTCEVLSDGRVRPPYIKKWREDATNSLHSAAVASRGTSDVSTAISAGALLHENDAKSPLASLFLAALVRHHEVLKAKPALKEQLPNSFASIPELNSTVIKSVLDLPPSHIRAIALKMLGGLDHAVIREDLKIALDRSPQSVKGLLHIKNETIARMLQASVLPAADSLLSLQEAANMSEAQRSIADSCKSKAVATELEQVIKTNELLSRYFTDSVLTSAGLIAQASLSASRLDELCSSSAFISSAPSGGGPADTASSGSLPHEATDSDIKKWIIANLDKPAPDELVKALSAQKQGSGSLRDLLQLSPGTEDAFFAYLALEDTVQVQCSKDFAETPPAFLKAVLYGAIRNWSRFVSRDTSSVAAASESNPQSSRTMSFVEWSKTRAMRDQFVVGASGELLMPTVATSSASQSAKGKPTGQVMSVGRAVFLFHRTSGAVPTWKGFSIKSLEIRARFNTAKLMLGRSRIDGLGLFVTSDIEMDDVIAEYTGDIIDDLTCDAREVYYETNGIADYMFRMGPDEIADATINGCRARYINHCCDPNCFAVITLPEANDPSTEKFDGESEELSFLAPSVGVKKDGTAPSGRRVFVYALRRIPAGEELTYDYQFPSDERKIPCKCGAANCRGTLNMQE
jgi:hypothetical protein